MIKSETPDSEKTLWRTPGEFIRAVERRYGPIHLDAAASPGAEVCLASITPEDDALNLNKRWLSYQPFPVRGERARVWLNSPWGARITEKWVERAIDELDIDQDISCILLLTPHTDAGWWWKAAARSSETLHLGRLAFLRPNGEQCGGARDWHDLHVLRRECNHPGVAFLQKWDWRASR